MKKRPAPDTGPVISKEILDNARRAYEADRLYRASAKCAVCNEPCAPSETEQLCWVCRRLKISAWRDSDIQMNAQE